MEHELTPSAQHQRAPRLALGSGASLEASACCAAQRGRAHACSRSAALRHMHSEVSRPCPAAPRACRRRLRRSAVPPPPAPAGQPCCLPAPAPAAARHGGLARPGLPKPSNENHSPIHVQFVAAKSFGRPPFLAAYQLFGRLLFVGMFVPVHMPALALFRLTPSQPLSLFPNTSDRTAYHPVTSSPFSGFLCCAPALHL